jgi:hypothetical protein
MISSKVAWRFVCALTPCLCDAGLRIDATVELVAPDAVDTGSDDDDINSSRAGSSAEHAFTAAELDAQALQKFHEDNLAFDDAHDRHTLRYIRLARLMRANSHGAAGVFCSMPVPRPQVTAQIFLAWLELISKGFDTFVFVRGNQENVLSCDI